MGAAHAWEGQKTQKIVGKKKKKALLKRGRENRARASRAGTREQGIGIVRHQQMRKGWETWPRVGDRTEWWEATCVVCHDRKEFRSPTRAHMQPTPSAATHRCVMSEVIDVLQIVERPRVRRIRHAKRTGRSSLVVSSTHCCTSALPTKITGANLQTFCLIPTFQLRFYFVYCWKAQGH
jgi:hypothetical protein